MKNKEFRDLLVQYVEEISDPKNKEVYFSRKKLSLIFSKGI